MIGLFNESFTPIMDGVALTVENYAYWMNRKGVSVGVVVPKTPNYVDNELYPVYRYTSIPIPMRKPYRVGVPDIDISFKHDLDKKLFEVVHAHTPFSAGRLALQLAKKRHIPLVATFHSKYYDDFKRATHSDSLARLMLNIVMQFYEKADEVWVPQASVEEVIRGYGYKGKVEIVNNGSDYSTSEPLDILKSKARKELNLPEGLPVFLFVGQHIWEKNTALIIESLALLEGTDFRMFFIGTGYAQDKMKEMVEQLGLQEKVKFMGVIHDREKLKQYYAAADLFLFPSLYDNAPLVVRESSALGTPSIMVTGSTSAEVITDNCNGFLISNSKESLADKIKELIQSPEKIRQAGEIASHTVARSWENVTEEVLDRYKVLVKRYKA